MTGSTNARRRARQAFEKTGRRAEWAAALFLTAKGYGILERRFRAPSGEIDLIARRGSVIAFVEVKFRGNLDLALHAVSARARRRIERAADMYIAAHPYLAECAMRYDILALAPLRIRHLSGAWRYGE